MFMFFCIFDPPNNSWKSKVSPAPSNQGFLEPCPDDRAQNSVQDSLNESSVRPTPITVFFKNTFPILTSPVPPQYRPKPLQKLTPRRAWGVYRPQKRKILIGPVCIRFFRKQDLLEFSFFPAGGFSLPYPDQRTKGWAPYGRLKLDFHVCPGQNKSQNVGPICIKF